MANNFLTPQVITSTTLGLLERELILANLVWTNHGIDFSGAQGDAVTMRVPATTTANELSWRAEGAARDITMGEIVEGSRNVNLNHHIYSAVPVTDEELTLDITSFGERVLDPQARAVAKELDGRIANMIETGATYTQTVTGVNRADPWTGVVDARALLNKSNVGREGRTLLVGADFETAVLKSDRLSHADTSGSASALREARIGRMAGFDVVASNAIAADVAYAFVPSAFLLATRAPAIPAGAPFGAGASHAGFSMRWVRDYNANRAEDRSLVSCFAGFNVMLDDSELKRAVKLTLAPLA